MVITWFVYFSALKNLAQDLFMLFGSAATGQRSVLIFGCSASVGQLLICSPAPFVSGSAPDLFSCSFRVIFPVDMFVFLRLLLLPFPQKNFVFLLPCLDSRPAHPLGVLAQTAEFCHSIFGRLQMLCIRAEVRVEQWFVKEAIVSFAVVYWVLFIKHGNKTTVYRVL
jgi:hypothetical protein